MPARTDAVRAKFAEELKKAELEDSIESQVPAGFRMIYIVDVGKPEDRDTVASVSYGDYFVDLYKQDGAISWERAREILQALPAVPAIKVTDSSVWFTSAEFVNQANSEKKANWKTEDVCGVWFKVNWSTSGDGKYHTPHLTLHWLTKINDVGHVEIVISLGFPPPRLFNLSAKRVESLRSFRYETTKIQYQGDLYTRRHSHTNQDLDDFIVRDMVRWSSSENPNPAEIYFQTGKQISAPEMAELIMNKMIEMLGEK